MSDPAFDWETCKHTEMSASMAVRIAAKHVDDETLEHIKADVHDHASGMMMARGRLRAGRFLR